MGALQTLDEINTKLGILVEREKDMVSIPLPLYVEMKKVYEENKNQNYRIHLKVRNETFITEDGTRTQLSCIDTNKFCFPDDTHTQLSELFRSVYENSEWVKHLETKLAESKARIHRLECANEKLHQELQNKSWWRKWY